MNVAEKLAREIRRVAIARCLYDLESGDYSADRVLAVMDGALDQACRAAGSGDPVAMEAAGQQLAQFEE